MVVALRLAFIFALLVFAGLALKSGVSGTVSGVGMLAAGGIAMVTKGLKAPLPAFEALLCVSFILGLPTGAMPYLLANFGPEACDAADQTTMTTIWISGLVATGVGAALTVYLFKPRLALNRVPGARPFWLLIDALLVVGSYAALAGDVCAFPVGADVLLVPALSNAIFGLSVGWILSERHR